MTGRKSTIIVATMDSSLQNHLRKKFSDNHFDTFFVQRGAEAVYEMLNRDADIMILDLDMNGNVGVEVIPVIRKLRPRLPVILISDDFTHRVQRMAAEQSISYHASKPKDGVETEHIVEVTENIIAHRKLMHAN